jgi:uncharacterized membrane protein
VADFQLGLGVPGGVWTAAILAVLFGALAAVAMADLRTERRPRRRWALLGLRVVTAVVVWLVAVQPQASGERIRREPGRLAILVDGSRSMGVRTGDASRADRVAALLARWGSQAGDGAPVSFHVFASDVASVPPGRWRDPPPTDGDQTRIVEAIRSVGAGDAREDLGAVVVVSDGADTDGPPAADRLPHGVRVHAVAVGDDGSLEDDAIVRVKADPIGFLRQTAQVRVQVRALPAAQRTIPVTLREGERVVREVDVTLDEDGVGTVDLAFTPERLGRAVYRLSIPVEAGDAVPENNERAFLVRVTRDRLRVLLVAGRPSWDVRFLRSFLKRDPSIDLISFFILRTGADLTMAASDELALIPFPTDELFREHLGSFDLVLFQNFDFGPYGMAPYLSRVRDYVIRGGSFAMIGGDLSFASGGYAGTPIAEVLPVELPQGPAGRGAALVPGDFRPELVPGMEHHPLLELLPSVSANASAWASLAPLRGANLLTGLRDGAHTLLAHPEHRVDGRPMPVLATGSAGEGRLVALGSDSSWQWGMPTAGRTGDPSAYDRFWDRVVRWMARDPSLDPCQVTTDRERYGPTGKVRAQAWVRDDRYQPEADRRAHFELRDLTGEVMSESAARTDGGGKTRIEIPAPTNPGGYRLGVRLEGESEPRCEEWLVVEAGGDELADPRARPDWLRALTEARAGDFYGSPGEAPDLDALDASRTRSLGTVTHAPFASPWAFAVIALLLVLEWGVRRRWGYR